MKNLFLVALSFISIAAFSQNKNSLLYKVSGNGITAPSYIFGTIHISCDAKLDAKTLKALDVTTQMYLELDMDDPEMQVKMMNSMSMQKDVSISSLLSAEDYKLLDDYLMTEMKVSASLFNTYKPFVLSSMFMASLLDCKPQYFESELVRISTEQKEPVYGLETVEEQMSLFDQIPYQLQAEELIKSIKDEFKADKLELKLLLNAYAKKDLNLMQQLTSQSSSAMMSQYEDLLLNNRNKNWISKIERVSKEKPTFFGVGAAHLYGNEGVINLLRSAGYHVEAM